MGVVGKGGGRQAGRNNNGVAIQAPPELNRQVAGGTGT